MSLYPFINTPVDVTPNTEPLPIYKEYAWDFENDIPLIENGDFKVIEKNPAICVWIYHAIKTYKYAFSIYSWDYGCELDSLLGQNYTPGYTKAEANRFIKEALLINPYILEVSNVSTDFDGDVLTVTIKVKTIYGYTNVYFSI